jgi:hypothetical protein
MINASEILVYYSAVRSIIGLQMGAVSDSHSCETASVAGCLSREGEPDVGQESAPYLWPFRCSVVCVLSTPDFFQVPANSELSHNRDLQSSE